MLYYCFLILRKIVLIFPRGLSYFVARVLAFFYYLFAANDRSAVLYNISPFITDKREARKLATERGATPWNF